MEIKSNTFKNHKKPKEHIVLLVKKYRIPEHLKNKNYATDDKYRSDFKDWIEEIWAEKDKEMERLKY